MAYKGVQIAPMAPIASTVSAESHGAKILRYQLIGNIPLEQQLNNFNLFRHPFKTYVLDCHFIPPDPALMIPFWQDIATRYRHSSDTLVYGILNEPRDVGNVQTLMNKCVKAIRAIDPTVRIAVTPKWSDPQRYNTFPKLDYKHIWYEAHCYHRMELTHQGVEPQYPVGPRYPSAADNKKKLKAYLKPLRDFQLEHKVPIFIGEFSISKFADEQSRINYLTDCISIFNEYKWHWCYHAWRESFIWDVEPYPNVAQVLYDAWD